MWWTYVATLTSFFSLRIVFQFEKREKNDFLQRNTEYLLLYARSHKLQWPLPICLRMKKTGVCYSIKRITLGWTERERNPYYSLLSSWYAFFIQFTHCFFECQHFHFNFAETNERTNEICSNRFPFEWNDFENTSSYFLNCWLLKKKREKSTKSSRKSQSHPMHKYRGKNIHDGINECQRTGQS